MGSTWHLLTWTQAILSSSRWGIVIWALRNKNSMDPRRSNCSRTKGQARAGQESISILVRCALRCPSLHTHHVDGPLCKNWGQCHDCSTASYLRIIRKIEVTWLKLVQNWQSCYSHFENYWVEKSLGSHSWHSYLTLEKQSLSEWPWVFETKSFWKWLSWKVIGSHSSHS
jgi:hypothetical protein